MDIICLAESSSRLVLELSNTLLYPDGARNVRGFECKNLHFLICIHNCIATNALHQLTLVDMMFIIPIARYKIGIPLQP